MPGDLKMGQPARSNFSVLSEMIKNTAGFCLWCLSTGSSCVVFHGRQHSGSPAVLSIMAKNTGGFLLGSLSWYRTQEEYCCVVYHDKPHRRQIPEGEEGTDGAMEILQMRRLLAT